MTDTIFARASGAGRAGVAVYRLSGPDALAIAGQLVGRTPPPGRFARVRVVDPATGAPIDDGIALAFRAPRSFTGEDVVELQLHGAPAVERALFAALLALGARPAARGEFTRRAFVNGRMDLAEAEGLADLLDAETERQRLQALGQLGGRLSARAGVWRAQLVEALAALDAAVDFPDEADVPGAVAGRAGQPVAALLADLRAALAEAGRARTLRDGLTVALIGAPNAGKSSLLNRLAGEERAIVSERPGTTRDVVEAVLDLAGVPVALLDTAGLRDDPDDPVEAEGARRARARAEAADLRLLVRDVSRETPGTPEAGAELLQPGDLIVDNKSDLLSAPRPHGDGAAPAGVARLAVSARSGAGIDALLAALTGIAAARAAPPDGAPLTRARHVRAVSEAVSALERAAGRFDDAPELAAEDLRLAARALGRIVGAVDVEDLLDSIFSSFCIGK